MSISIEQQLVTECTIYPVNIIILFSSTNPVYCRFWYPVKWSENLFLFSDFSEFSLHDSVSCLFQSHKFKTIEITQISTESCFSHTFGHISFGEFCGNISSSPCLLDVTGSSVAVSIVNQKSVQVNDINDGDWFFHGRNENDSTDSDKFFENHDEGLNLRDPYSSVRQSKSDSKMG